MSHTTKTVSFYNTTLEVDFNYSYKEEPAITTGAWEDAQEGSEDFEHWDESIYYYAPERTLVPVELRTAMLAWLDEDNPCFFYEAAMDHKEYSVDA